MSKREQDAFCTGCLLCGEQCVSIFLLLCLVVTYYTPKASELMVAKLHNRPHPTGPQGPSQDNTLASAASPQCTRVSSLYLEGLIAASILLALLDVGYLSPVSTGFAAIATGKGGFCG